MFGLMTRAEHRRIVESYDELGDDFAASARENERLRRIDSDLEEVQDDVHVLNAEIRGQYATNDSVTFQLRSIRAEIEILTEMAGSIVQRTKEVRLSLIHISEPTRPY